MFLALNNIFFQTFCDLSMRKLNAIVLVAALVMVSCADIIELLECDPSFGDHVIPSPEYCDRLYSQTSDKIIHVYPEGM